MLFMNLMKKSLTNRFGGSTVVKNEVLQKALCDRVRLSYPNAEIRISMCDAAEGAVQWALQRNCELAMQKRMGEGR